MSWDKTNLLFSVNAPAWGKGNAPASFNTGVIPSYLGGAWQDCTLTNMGSGYGFVNAGTSSYFNFDALDDYVALNKTLDLTNASKFTIEIKALIAVIADYQGLFASYLNGDSVGLRTYIGKYTDAAYDQIAFTVATGGYGAITSTRITNGVHTIHMVKDGAAMKVYIDAAECSYAYQVAYSKGSVTCDRPLRIGVDFDYTKAFNGKMYVINFYDDAISQARITNNAALDISMGETANNVGAVLSYVTASGAMPVLARKMIQRGSNVF